MKTKTGVTTRMIDRCIQELFINGFTYVYDGRGTSEMKDKTEKAYRTLITMLENEHPTARYVSAHGFYDGIECYKIETHNL